MKLPPARVWVFDQAPKYLQSLSSNGGDEDWIVELPPYMEPCNLHWVDAMDSDVFPKRYLHPRRKGWAVYIGSHS